MFIGCPSLRRLWLDGLWADLFLLAGGIARRARAWRRGRRVVRRAAALAGVARARGRRDGASSARRPTCSASALLLLFAPPFGLLRAALLLRHRTPTRRRCEDAVGLPPLDARPVAGRRRAARGRVPAADARARLDTMGEDYVRTARRRACRGNLVVRRHAARRRTSPSPRCSAPRRRSWSRTWCWSSTCSRSPGFFRHMKRALGQAPGWPPTLDIPTLQALAHVGGGADRRAQPARRPRDRPARPGPTRRRAPARLISSPPVRARISSR